jgi:hypothetical protein
VCVFFEIISNQNISSVVSPFSHRLDKFCFSRFVFGIQNLYKD